ncbi:MAG TPA: DUF2203 domain-containing protein [Miltoncostaeaceae bacterium]|nr:DUF2203 domain-containing protein [Miltoncostaeaceae bacterium]
MTAERQFTLEEARLVLHALRPAVEALQAVQQQLRAVKAELNALNRRHLNNGVVAEARTRSLRLDQRRLGEEARTQIGVITAAGAEIKGIDDGLLDFPTTIQGGPAYWCWRAGEDEIDWWHPRSTGFSGRRPISEAT